MDCASGAWRRKTEPAGQGFGAAPAGTVGRSEGGVRSVSPEAAEPLEPAALAVHRRAQPARRPEQRPARSLARPQARQPATECCRPPAQQRAQGSLAEQGWPPKTALAVENVS